MVPIASSRSAADCKTCPVRAMALYAPLACEEVPALTRLRRRTLALDARRIILRERERPAEVYTLLEGWAFRFKLLPDGRRQILSFLLPGDFIALPALHLEPLGFSVQALTAVRLCAFEPQEMTDFLRSRPPLSWNVAATCVRNAAALDARIIDLGRRTALERVARLLLELRDRLRQREMDSPAGIPFPLRQEHVADALGLTTVHISRTMATLRSEGVLTLAHGVLAIHDPERLAEIAGRVSNHAGHARETKNG